MNTDPADNTEYWRSINTAPQDGTNVMLLCPGNRITIAHFDDMPFVGKGWIVSVPCAGGWGRGTDTIITFPEDQPTHWRPLYSSRPSAEARP